MLNSRWAKGSDGKFHLIPYNLTREDLRLDMATESHAVGERGRDEHMYMTEVTLEWERDDFTEDDRRLLGLSADLLFTALRDDWVNGLDEDEDTLWTRCLDTALIWLLG